MHALHAQDIEALLKKIGIGVDLRNPIIVGIDPGTTTAAVILDLSGNILSIQSGKNLKRSDVINLILEKGDPIIIASDVYPVPKSIEKLAASFNCKLIHPEENYSRRDKWSFMRSNFEETYRHKKLYKNRHERDALLAAIFGWNAIKALVNKIETRLEGEEIFEYRDQIKSKVILEGRSISSAMKEYC